MVALSHPMACSATSTGETVQLQNRSSVPHPGDRTPGWALAPSKTHPVPKHPEAGTSCTGTPGSKDPPEKPKVLQPSAKCPFRTHRDTQGDTWVSCPGQSRAVKLWQCHVPIKPCSTRPGWQHLPLHLHLPAFPAASPVMWQH